MKKAAKSISMLKDTLKSAVLNTVSKLETSGGSVYGWPFSTGSGGGCYSCSQENCDDDTGEDADKEGCY